MKKAYKKLPPNQIKKARQDAGLTQTQAAKLIGSTLRTWQNWEAPEGSGNHRQMPEPAWRLFQLLTEVK
jgi:DNA-binding transcriptional regulator YiaG